MNFNYRPAEPMQRKPECYYPDVRPDFFYEMDNVNFSPIKRKSKFDSIFENEEVIVGAPEYHLDFLYFLKDRIMFFKEIDYYRNRILQISSINLISLFDYIDQYNNGELNQHCFFLFLKELGINASEKDISYIFKRFCTRDLNGMNIKEFISVFESPNRKFVTYNVPEFKGKSLKELIKNEKLLLVRKLFRLFIDSEQSAEYMRLKLHEKNADTRELFSLIKGPNNEYVSASDFVHFFDRQGYNLRDQEVYLLMQVFDMNHSDKINWTEFLSEIEIWDPQYY